VPSQPASELTDEALLAACRKGDQSAWEALIKRYSSLIYSIPLRYGLSEADAGDVFQAVCETLVEKLDSIRDPKRLAAWLITTTTRESWAAARSRRREITQGGAPLADDDDLVEAQPTGESPTEDELLAIERRAIVQAAVSQLPEACRHLVQALFSDDQHRPSYQELADSLGIPLNSLGPTRSRCLDRLRRVLEAYAYF
jgi:RNA polymerase sigma factor (sigma-70 family)